MNDAELFSRARSAYERGRWTRSLSSAPVVILLVIASFAACNAPVMSLAIGLALLATCTISSWRGQAYGRAVTPGLVTGSCAALIPFIEQTCGFCVPGAISSCMMACILGGLLAGAAITTRALRLERDGRSFAAIAGTIAVLTGALGCTLVGIGGVLGMFAGLSITAAPALILARAVR